MTTTPRAVDLLSIAQRDQFWSRVDKSEDCWIWSAGKDGNGYGVAIVGSRSDGTYRHVKAHRLSYELTVGQIPDGLQVDHLCRVRACVNPAHLEPVTQRENILRGEGASAKAARQTHCKRGHPLSGDNLMHRADANRRECLTCHRDRERSRLHDFKFDNQAQAGHLVADSIPQP